jgi:hypothetical protein
LLFGYVNIYSIYDFEGKILSVLTDIKKASDINADPKVVRFDFNHYISGAGILTNDEEARILCKLRDMGFIQLPPRDREGIVTSVTDEQMIARLDSTTIRLADNFNSRYFFYKLFTFKEKGWNYINPFWLIVQMFKSVWFSVVWLWNKSRAITSGISLIGGLVVYDWATAWQTAGKILNLVKTFFE